MKELRSTSQADQFRGHTGAAATQATLKLSASPDSPFPQVAELGFVHESVWAEARVGDRPNCGRDLSLVSTRGKSSGAASRDRGSPRKHAMSAAGLL